MAVRAVLRVGDARRYLVSVVVSGFGDSMMALVAGVWVKTVTGSDGLAALTGCCLWLPTLAGPALGAVADRVRRRTRPNASGCCSPCSRWSAWASR